MTRRYPSLALHIDGAWIHARERATIPVLNPATDEVLGDLPCADPDDLEAAAAAADRGFRLWKAISPYERAKVLRRAAAILRERAADIAPVVTLEQGKPLAESMLEVETSAEIIEWFADEGRRTYGRIVPARAADVQQLVIREPVGPVAAFTPWNFPIGQATRKLAAALSAGCSVILKGPEDTPASCMALVRALLDGGVPSEALALVFGDPAAISAQLTADARIRKISFTGSTAVGKQLAAMAGTHMKRATMELGGHAPAIVFADADIELAAATLAAGKFRNAGQICIAPTRFLIEAPVHDRFLAAFTEHARRVQVGDGLAAGTTMGPLAHARRVMAMEAIVADAAEQGAAVHLGGARIGNRGSFFQPTILTGVTPAMQAMNEEPFGPIALIGQFSCEAEAITEANRLAFGLAAYAWTRSAATVARLSAHVESGMLSINHQGLALIETPFVGVKDSGYGSEGGVEAMEPYLNTRFVSHRTWEWR